MKENAKIEAEASRGDDEKVESLIVDLEALKLKYRFKSKENYAKMKAVSSLLDQAIEKLL